MYTIHHTDTNLRSVVIVIISQSSRRKIWRRISSQPPCLKIVGAFPTEVQWLVHVRASFPVFTDLNMQEPEASIVSPPPTHATTRANSAREVESFFRVMEKNQMAWVLKCKQTAGTGWKNKK